MQLLRLLFAYATLILLALFIRANIFQIDQTSGSHGLPYLYASFIAFFATVTVAGDLTGFLKVKKATFILFAFITYAIVKYYMEANQFQFRAVTIGSTQGLLFSLAMGITASYPIFTLYSLYNTRKWSTIVAVLTIVYLSVLTVSLFILIKSGMDITKSDSFRIDENIKYQRPGDLLILQMLISSSVAFVLFTKHTDFKLAKFFTLTVLVVSIGVLTGLLSQIFGSNKGLLAGIAIAIIFVTCSFTAQFSKFNQSIKITGFLFGRTGLYMFLGLILSTLILGGSTLAALNIMEVDYTETRIGGDGLTEEGKVVSIDSRTAIFKKNFFKHFYHSPIFGHTQVEKILGDENEYVHSTLSVLTHLGLFGFLIFLLLVLSMYFEITRGNGARRLNILPNNSIYSLFRLSLLSCILTMGIFTAFFTWMPLWFSIGFIGTWFGFNAHSALPTQAKKQKRRRRKVRTSYTQGA